MHTHNIAIITEIQIGGGGVLLYISLMGMCHCEGYGFEAVLVSDRVSKSDGFGLE